MKRRLLRESFSEEQQESVLKMYFQMPDSDRKEIKKAIKECLREFTSQNDVLKLEIGIGLFGLASLVYGLFAKDPSIWGMGIAALGFAGVSLKVDRNAILKCAAEKLGMSVDEMMDIKRGKNQESSEMMPESRRVVKLTESDLNRIVRRIIKEDEMMTGPSKGFTIAGLYKKSGYSAPLPQRLVISKVKGKIKVDGIDKSVGSVNTSSKIECMGDCEIMFRDVKDLGEISITVTNGKPKLFVTSE
jgi:hypothetical protein